MDRPNYRERERIRKRLKAIGAPCAICGRPIDYDLDWWTDPRDGKRKRHPWSFEYDHRKPLRECANDGDSRSVRSFENAQPAHRICNQRKGGRMVATVPVVVDAQIEVKDCSRRW